MRPIARSVSQSDVGSWALVDAIADGAADILASHFLLLSLEVTEPDVADENPHVLLLIRLGRR